MERTGNDEYPSISQPNSGASSSTADPNSESSCATRNNRNRLKHTWVPGRGGVAEAWVLLDADGNTQQVFEHEVNILLGGRSADTVLASIPSHPVRSLALDRSTLSETDRRLEPIIQESLLMLRRENVVGESYEPKRLGLERKAGNLLMHFTQPQPAPADFVQQAPSVHFVDIEPDRILLWRHSQDFDGGNENINRPFIYGRTTRSIYYDQAQESHVNPTMEINSEIDPHEFYNCNQLRGTKSGTSLKKKGLTTIINKFLNKPKTEESCNDPMQSERGGKVFEQNYVSKTGSISATVLKLEEDVRKYKEEALMSDQRVQEEVREKALLQRKLAQANQKERNLNKFLAKEQEKRLINYTSSPIYDLVSVTEPESYSNANSRSIQTYEQSLSLLAREIHDLRTAIFDSENLVKQSIVKYIANKQLEKDLVQAVGSYSYTKIEGEQKVISLAKDLIEEQVQIMKQLRLSSESHEALLKKQIQVLEDENILFLNKLEKMEIRGIQNANEAGLMNAQSGPINYIHDCKKINERLRDKLSSYQSRADKLEVQLSAAQDKTEHLEILVRSNKMEIENQKMLNSRLETDHEMECSAIKAELAMKSQILYQSSEVADILLKDITSLKLQLKETDSRVRIEWNAVHNGNNILESLLHMSRTYINELGREVISLHTKINQANSEIRSQQNERGKLEAAWEETNQKKNLLTARLQEAIDGKEKSINKSEILAQEIDRLQDHLSLASQQIVIQEEELIKLRQENFNNPAKNEVVLNDQMDRFIQRALTTTSSIGLDLQIKKLTEEKYHILEDLKGTEQKVKHLEASLCQAEEKNNNYAITLKELQRENSAINGELNSVHVQSNNLSEMEKEIYKLSAEKACLADKLQDLKDLKTENKELREASRNFLTQSQSYQIDMDLLVQENNALKQQHETDHSVLLCLGNNARLAAGDEDDCHISAVKFMESELMAAREKVQKLESTVENNNKTIRNLEKDLAEKEECFKDYDIGLAQLSHSNQLEMLTLEQKKEQLEINICSLNRDNQDMTANISIMQKEIDFLSGKLRETENQLQKYVNLEKELDCNQNQFAELDVQRREENSELKGRLKDFNNIMNQRDKLIENQREFLIQAENLHGNLQRRDKRIASLTRQCAAKTSEIVALTEKLQQSESVLSESNRKAETKLNGVQEELQSALKKLFEYERQVNVMDYDIEKHSCRLVGEITKERQAKMILEVEVNHLKSVIDGNQVSLDQALKQIGSMRKVEKDLRNMLEDERRQRYETEALVKRLEVELKESVSIVEIVDEEKQRYDHLNDEYCKYKETVCQFNEGIDKKVGIFKQELATLKEERDALTKKIADVEVRNQALQENCTDFQKNLSELTLERSNYMEQIKSLLREMKDLGLTKYQVELTAREEKRSRENLELNHKELSTKLLEAVRMVIYEKMGRERIENQCQEFDSVIEKLLSEKKLNEEKFSELTAYARDLETRVKLLNDDRQNFDFELKATLMRENDLKISNEMLRKKNAEIKRAMDENSIFNFATLENEAQETSEESVRLYEDRFERLANQLKEAREQLLGRRLEETKLRKTIFALQSEKSVLSEQLRSLERLEADVTQMLNQLRKVCRKFLMEYDEKVPFFTSLTTIRHLVSTTQ